MFELFITLFFVFLYGFYINHVMRKKKPKSRRIHMYQLYDPHN